MGKSVIIDLPQDAAEIFVADPKVANAVVRSPRKLYVIGMDPGQTSVFALDQQGRQIAALELSIGRDVGELQQILRAAMPAAAITARTVNDTIILTGVVDSIEDAQRAGDIAKGFVQQVSAGGPPGAPGATGASGVSADGRIVNVLTIRGRDQVMLKVTVASRDIAKQLGITTSSLTASWGTFTQIHPFAINNLIAEPPFAGIGYSLAASAGLGDAALTAHNPANTLTATLQAFERYGVTRILAEPTVSAVSGESVKLTVGGEIPSPSAPTCAAATGTGAEGRILLHLATEVTEIDTQTSAIVFGTLVPGFLTRKNETTVEVPSGRAKGREIHLCKACPPDRLLRRGRG